MPAAAARPGPSRTAVATVGESWWDDTVKKHQEAGDRRTSPERLRELAQDANKSIVAGVAWNPNTPRTLVADVTRRTIPTTESVTAAVDQLLQEAHWTEDTQDFWKHYLPPEKFEALKSAHGRHLGNLKQALQPESVRADKELLHWMLIGAIKGGHGDTVKAVLDAGADPNGSKRPGVPMSTALAEGNFHAAFRLLDAGADLSHHDAYQLRRLWNVLQRHGATQQQIAKVTWAMIPEPPVTEARRRTKRDPQWREHVNKLHDAVLQGDLQALREVLPLIGADRYILSNALSSVARNTEKYGKEVSQGMTQALLDAGADPNFFRSEQGKSEILHNAILFNPHIVMMLVDAGASTQGLDGWALTEFTRLAKVLNRHDLLAKIMRDKIPDTPLEEGFDSARKISMRIKRNMRDPEYRKLSKWALHSTDA